MKHWGGGVTFGGPITLSGITRKVPKLTLLSGLFTDLYVLFELELSSSIPGHFMVAYLPQLSFLWRVDHGGAFHCLGES